jgi:hypothetical protein
MNPAPCLEAAIRHEEDGASGLRRWRPRVNPRKRAPQFVASLFHANSATTGLATTGNRPQPLASDRRPRQCTAVTEFRIKSCLERRRRRRELRPRGWGRFVPANDGCLRECWLATLQQGFTSTTRQPQRDPTRLESTQGSSQPQSDHELAPARPGPRRRRWTPVRASPHRASGRRAIQRRAVHRQLGGRSR